MFQPSNEFSEPIETVEALAQFIILDENDEGGYNYLKGIVAYYNGQPLTGNQVRATLYFVLFDKEVSGRFHSVSQALVMPVFQVLRLVLDQMCEMYRRQVLSKD